MPDLSNVHFLDRGLYWSTLAYIIFVCLAAASSFLLALFAGRGNSAKDMELKKLQSTSSQAVAHAHASAAWAAAQAALAHKEQKRLQADIVQVEAHREALRKENLGLQLAVEKERAARLQLEQHVAPRHMGSLQRQTVETALAAFRGERVSIVTYPGDAEIAEFANEIRTALEAAGLTVSMAPALVFGKPQPGIALEVGANRRQQATALARAFVDSGVCSGPITAAESDDAEMLEITVGPKP